MGRTADGVLYRFDGDLYRFAMEGAGTNAKSLGGPSNSGRGLRFHRAVTREPGSGCSISDSTRIAIA